MDPPAVGLQAFLAAGGCARLDGLNLLRWEQAAGMGIILREATGLQHTPVTAITLTDHR